MYCDILLFLLIHPVGRYDVSFPPLVLALTEGRKQKVMSLTKVKSNNNIYSSSTVYQMLDYFRTQALFAFTFILCCLVLHLAFKSIDYYWMPRSLYDALILSF